MIQENLQNKLINEYGEELTKTIFEGFSSNRVVSLRINTIKTTKELVLKILKENNISPKSVDELIWGKQNKKSGHQLILPGLLPEVF